MAFNPVSNQVPTSIGTITIVLRDNPEAETQKTITYELTILDQDGTPIRDDQDSGDLVPHLTQTQIDWLLQFGNDMRALAEGQLLP